MLPARPRARELFFQWFPCVKIMPRHTLLQHVRQKKSDDEHHRASGAVNRKRLRLGSARLALEKARTRATPETRSSLWRPPTWTSPPRPPPYDVMFTLSLTVPFDPAATPPGLRFAFTRLHELFRSRARSRR